MVSNLIAFLSMISTTGGATSFVSSFQALHSTPVSGHSVCRSEFRTCIASRLASLFKDAQLYNGFGENGYIFPPPRPCSLTGLEGWSYLCVTTTTIATGTPTPATKRKRLKTKDFFQTPTNSCKSDFLVFDQFDGVDHINLWSPLLYRHWHAYTSTNIITEREMTQN